MNRICYLFILDLRRYDEYEFDRMLDEVDAEGSNDNAPVASASASEPKKKVKSKSI